jgi:regulator of sirC expression with transglutaminase-like and TPR domain
MKDWTIADELSIVPANMARVALMIAQAIQYPSLDINHYLDELAGLALEAERYVPADDPPHFRSLLLAETLFHRFSFTGNRENYGDPRNSFVNDVLESRRGIPITLSILFLEIARRMKIPAYGIGMPGHFIVGVSAGSETWYLDPFDGGGRLSLNECARLVQITTGYSGPFQSQWLAPADARAIAVRLLNNLRAIYAQGSEWESALRVINLLRMVQPDAPEHYRDMGLIYYRRGATIKAARYLDAYLRQVPDAEDADTIREGIANAIDLWARLN